MYYCIVYIVNIYIYNIWRFLVKLGNSNGVVSPPPSPLSLTTNLKVKKGPYTPGGTRKTGTKLFFRCVKKKDYIRIIIRIGDPDPSA